MTNGRQSGFTTFFQGMNRVTPLSGHKRGTERLGTTERTALELTIVDSATNLMDARLSHGETEQLASIGAAMAEKPTEDHAFRKAKEKAADWWQTPQGQKADQYLNAWALTVLARVASGDPTALPSFAFGSGKGRTTPSDPADVLLFFADIDRAIREGTTEDERRLILFIHGQQTEERCTRLQYLLEEHPHPFKLDRRGDLRPRTDIPIWSDELDPSDPPPARHYAEYQWREKVKPEAQLAAFPCREIDALMSAWFVSDAERVAFKVKFLKARHLAIGRGVARAVGA